MKKTIAQTLIEEGKEIGKEEGKEEGKEIGTITTKQEVLIKLLNRKLGQLPQPLIEKVRSIQRGGELDALIDFVIEAETVDEVKGKVAEILA